ncbi:uncharacterized protein RHOBADRAFT_54128 [Rhodotorula graminis WP1]|uniref:U2A'/phosphoprotein 32 family A C-terminal domain-containing protein n=1 Tax=Rhodotorula graminis (strain WP1) TaxID=578459 RepID=A0A194S163_RHOGW|nr:uncharacterized protein RHOBADRAFT_54128 [Rhodotorula graminis WP1]KPV74285.1 hypothetical protein RHOBADRAFT_54128 [Rhodotorula graminis WP1]
MPQHSDNKHQPPRKPYTKPAPDQPRSSAARRPRPFSRDNLDEGTKQRRGPPPDRSKPPTKAKPQPAQLDLSGQQLTAPPAPADLANVAKLNLSNCALSSIAFAKHAATSLTWLNLSGNALADPGAWAGIDQLQTLFVLNASHCGLTEVPACVASLSKLKALVLSHNSLTALKHVANLPDLNTIVVSNNALTALPSTLATLPSLKKISAAHNRLTSSSLPDLSPLAHLHELRLNDNPTLTSLPPHFGTWGKADGAKGLEILDIGNCGFESWFGLRELAKQDAVVNLGLKGNKVAEDAVRDAGFDNFKAKLTILLPSLRILDTHRFDAKHADLKTRRALRTEEQRILDAGPMALAANAKRDAPVAVDDVVRARERERENRRRRKKGIQEEVGEGRKNKRVRDDEDGDGDGDGASVEPGPATAGAGSGSAGAEGTDDKASAAVDDERKKPKKRKSRAEKRAAKEGGAGEGTAGGPGAAEALPAPVVAEALSPSTATVDASATTAVTTPKDKKDKKKKAGVLAALQGDSSASSSSSKTAPASTSAPVPAPAPAPKEEKQKTSVAKIIEVRRPGAVDGKGGKKRKAAAAATADDAAAQDRKVDVGALLGLSKPVEVGRSQDGEQGEAQAPAAHLAGLGAAAGSGLFGGAGWD